MSKELWEEASLARLRNSQKSSQKYLLPRSDAREAGHSKHWTMATRRASKEFFL
jgi:hypothetical protein